MARVIGISGKKQSGKTSLAYYIKARILQGYKFKETDIIIDDEGEVYLMQKTPGYPPSNVKDLHSSKVGIYSFGDTLKECCIQTLGLSREQCYGTDDQKNTLTKYLWDNLPMSVRLKYSNESKEEEVLEYAVDDSGQFGSTWKTYKTNKIPRSGHLTAREVMQVFGTDICRDMFHDDIWVDATFKKIEKDDVEVAIIADVRFPSEINAITSRPDYKIVRLDRIKDISDSHLSETALDSFDWKTLGSNSFVIDNRNMSIVEKNEIAYAWLFK